MSSRSDPDLTTDDSTIAKPSMPEDAPREVAAGSRTFRVIRLHAEGGLGAVYLAEDIELRREVALKEMLPNRAASVENRRQFLAEAELTGKLEHPGIVPVYGLGEHADGRPFYIMRFVRGGSLAEAIRRFHGAKASFHGREFRGLLSRFVGVCNAIAFAHSRGIIHCDLKPANILLGEFGETLVVDWGLAVHDDAERRETLSTARPTMFGTPAFLAPEQAMNEPIRATTDVYSLGATLYAMLTGREPHQGGGLERIRQAVTGEFARPREVRREVPLSLEAVCLKAMALKPADRYSSPLALAADLEQWLADEPVSCHRDSISVRASRWARRNRTKVAALTALLVTAVIALFVGLLLVNRERGRTARERDEKEMARAVAQASEVKAQNARRRTRQALDELSSSLVEDWLAKQTKFDREQQAFLTRALASYDAFAAEGGDDPETLLAVADAYYRAGAIRHRLGQSVEAESDFRRSRDILTTLIERHPERLDVRVAVAARENARGTALFHGGRPAEAEAAHRASLAGYERLRLIAPPELSFAHQEARVKINLGIVLQAQSRPEEAEKMFREARDAFEQMRAINPALNFDDDLCAIALNLGKLLTTARRFEEAETVYTQGLQLRRRLVAALPRDLQQRHDLANQHNNLAILMRVSGRPAKAEPNYREAIRLLKELADEYPAVPSYRYDLANARDNLAITLVALGKLPEAESLHRSALTEKIALATAYPDLPDYVVSVAGNRCNLANVLARIGRIDEAVAEYGLAVRALDGVREKNPGHANAKEFLIASLTGRAMQGDVRRRHADAAADWGRVIELMGPAAGMNYRMQRALALARSGKAPEALAEVATALGAWDIPPPGLWDVARLYGLAGPRYAAEAVAMLRRANAAGFFKKTDMLLSQADLDRLRFEPAFRAWMVEMKLPAPEMLPMPR